MCGIIAFSGDFNHDNIKKSINLLKHRGPDDTGYSFSENIGLGHTRLSIQDLSSAGSQPMTDEKNNITIIFNGEIYNVNSLRRELVELGYTFKSKSDTEVILYLYAEKKFNLLEKIDGIYSIVIWDRTDNFLFIARDPIGIKPLYFYNKNNKFMCASEIKSLISMDEVSKNLDYTALFSHLVFLWSPHPNTIIDNVKKLEPGNAMIVKNGEIKKRWSFSNLKFTENNKYKNKLEPINELEDVLKNSISKQLISDVPIGSFLSGGVDSSLIVSMVKSLHSDIDLKTFTINLEGINESKEGMNDDLPYAKYMANKLNLELNIINVDQSLAGSLEKMIYHLDEPNADLAALNTMLISGLAREHGVKVLLSGIGGDDLFTGYRRHSALMAEKLWKWLPKRIKTNLPDIIDKVPNYNTSIRRIKKALQYVNKNEDDRICSYFYWFNPDLIHTLLSNQTKNKLDGINFSKLIGRELTSLKGYHPINKMLHIEMSHFLADHNLHYADKMGMAEGVEIRVPLLDRDVIDFALQLPINYKYRYSTKWILKQVAKKYLPNKIINRKKTGFGVPLRHWMQHDFNEIVNETLSKNSINRRGIFSYSGINQMRKNNNIDFTYTLFSIVCFELWCRRFIDR